MGKELLSSGPFEMEDRVDYRIECGRNGRLRYKVGCMELRKVGESDDNSSWESSCSNSSFNDDGDI